MCRDYIGTEWYREQSTQADRKGVNVSLRKFGKRLCKEFREMGIPIFVREFPDVDVPSMVVEHCILERELPDLCWIMIGAKAAMIADLEGYDVRQSKSCPWQFELGKLRVDKSEQHDVLLDDDGWPVVVDPRWRRVNHKWVFVDDPDAALVHF